MTRRPDEGKPPVVRKAGMSYQLLFEDIATTLTLSRIRRRSDGIHGYLTARTTGLDVLTANNTGVLLVGAIHLDVPKQRKEFAAALATKTPGFDIDWLTWLDHFAERVNVMEMTGEPIVEIGDTPVPKTAGTWSWEPFVPKGAPALFYGPGGSGKSRFALAGAISVKMGREILPNCPPNVKGQPLYLDWETDRDTVAERVQMICAGLGQPPVSISYRRCVRPLADDVEELGSYIAAKEIVFLVVDSAAAAIGKQGEYGDANEGALRLFEALRILGLPTVLVDHISKQEMRMSGKVRGALPYGSIYKVNMARAAWEVRPVDVNDDEVHVSAFHHTKSNDSRLRSPFGVRVAFDDTKVEFEAYDGPLSDADLDDDTFVRKVVPKDVSKQIEELLRGAKMEGPEIAKYLGIDNETIRKALNRGKGRRFIKDEVSGLWTAATTKLTILPGGGPPS